MLYFMGHGFVPLMALGQSPYVVEAGVRRCGGCTGDRRQFQIAVVAERGGGSRGRSGFSAWLWHGLCIVAHLLFELRCYSMENHSTYPLSSLVGFFYVCCIAPQSDGIVLQWLCRGCLGKTGQRLCHRHLGDELGP